MIIPPVMTSIIGGHVDGVKRHQLTSINPAPPTRISIESLNSINTSSVLPVITAPKAFTNVHNTVTKNYEHMLRSL